MAALGRISGGALFLVVFGLLALLAWRTLPTTAATVPSPQSAADFARAWVDGSLDHVAYDPASGPDVSDRDGEVDAERIAENVRWLTEEISASDEDRPIAAEPVGEPRRQRGDSGDLRDGDLLQAVDVTWDLGQQRRWTYTTQVVNRETDGVVRVLWRPSTVHPALTHGLVLRSRRLLAPRADVLDVTRRPVDPAFAPELVGRAQPATHELAETYPDRVEDGDVIGISGLQHVYDDRLAGAAGVEVYVARVEEYEPLQPWVRQVHVLPPTPGRPLLLSLDPTWQQRARTAVAGAGAPTSMVALNALTGEVLAEANHDTGGQDLALQGRYPPGTALRPLLALALNRSGALTTSTTLDCTPWALSQQRFVSSPEAAGPAVDLASGFAQGCTSGFARLAASLSDRELTDAATSLGFTRPDETRVTAFNGALPPAPDTLTRVQGALGTGDALASPLAMARLAATIRTGLPQPPRLVLPVEAGTPPPTPTPSPAAGLSGAEQQLLQQLLAVSVTVDNDLAALREARAGRVSAVGGTATGYGPPQDAQSSAWCVGYQGGIAFAVHVKGSPAAPAREAVAAQVAAAFLG